jgi:(1->4)-alpha-D-glucan 1-alpha-D-glucosylmutase
MEGYLLKALREAKRHTSWVHGNEAYENAATALLAALLAPAGAFLSDFRPLARRLSTLGMLNGLARTALKATLPGIPDIYQGTEFWDLSLVDPDNRRPVDYDARARALEAGDAPPHLLASWHDGRVKQALLARLLADRAGTPALYADGAYQPLEATGDKARHVLAFQRACGSDALVVAVPRLVAALGDGEALPLGGAWGDAALPLPPGRWRNILTDGTVEAGEAGCSLGELFADFPIAILRNRA